MDELKAEREAREREQSQASNSQSPASESAEKVSSTKESAEVSDLQSQFQELFETIDEELKAANPLTVLVVFALGVLMGRLLPR